MSRISRAVSGDEQAAALLLQEGIESLKRRAAKIPKKTKARNKKSTIKNALSPIHTQPRIDTDMLRRASALDFPSWKHSKEFFAKQYLKPLMPMMPLAQMNKALYEIIRWLNGRAWICGSAALWAASGDGNWNYSDIDIFCRSCEFFEQLTAEIYDLDEYGYDEQSERSRVFEDSPFAELQGGASLNLVSPVEGDDWSNIENVLLDFDLSICAVAIANQSQAYAYSPFDIRMRHISAVKIKYQRKFLKRLMKYMGRGYIATSDVFEAMLEHGGFDADFELLEASVSLSDSTMLRDFVNCYEAQQYQREHDYDYDDYDDYDSDDDDEESWY